MARLEVPVRLRWSDIDAYAHVNNAQMITLLEEARIEAFWRHPVGAGDDPGGAVPATAVLDSGPGAATSTLIARQEIQYLRPLPYLRRGVVVDLWIGHLGGASLDVCYEVRDVPADGAPTVYARATTTVVVVDAASGAPRRLTDAERAAWQPYVEAPVVIRRRPS